MRPEVRNMPKLKPKRKSALSKITVIAVAAAFAVTAAAVIAAIRPAEPAFMPAGISVLELSTSHTMPHPDERPLVYRETFNVTVNVLSNPGFAVLPLRVWVPEGLELVRLHIPQSWYDYRDMGGLITGPPSWMDNRITEPIVGPRYAFVNWISAVNFEYGGALAMFTFRVNTNTTELTTTDYIRIGTGVNPDVPAEMRLPVRLRDDGREEELLISFPYSDDYISAVIRHDDLTALRVFIDYARRLHDEETSRSPAGDGTDVPRTEWWARDDAFDYFLPEIEAAEAVYYRIRAEMEAAEAE